MIVLGADVGGTSSRVVLYDDNVERGRTEGPGTAMRIGEGERIATWLADLARPLLLRGRAARADVFVVGAAGAGRDAERVELQQALDRQRLAWRVMVTTDAELAREAAFEGGPGVLLIAGTGSIAFAKHIDGSMHRVGGLGWRMGDQGSGYWLGAHALQAVGAMHDGWGTVTHLAEALCVAAGVQGMAALIRWSTTATPAQVAALGPAIVTCAGDGDQVAIDLRESAVAALVRLALAAGAGPLPVALSGGLLAPDRPLRAVVTAALEARNVNVVRRAVDPCRGALAPAWGR
ncbi:MAG TPA: BadF/BadG/BcrA/BcrD ATPase family protein [Gemmatimonadales bacterium]|nr:BadF/BadG/BcrA/BcrD ATPase family protein [Gemmatimonadales bacterium]